MTKNKMEKENGRNVEREWKSKTALEYMVGDVASDVWDVSKKVVKGVGYLASAPIVGMLSEKRKVQIYGGRKLAIGAQIASIVTAPILKSYAAIEGGLMSGSEVQTGLITLGIVAESITRAWGSMGSYSSCFNEEGHFYGRTERRHFGTIEGELFDAMYSSIEKYFVGKWEDAKEKVGGDVEDVVKGGGD